ncbi:3,4-dihydroxy-2-butanone-4-phosphate synthase [Desertivibrio insolitus]|uniref:3,4-dihydroxy-2-butanone-4-phosphate synthase n=1 Tax=Herbiconiux sp. SYSU D00978 TaxID=2812562 RepID=UPI001A977005|nr:3,4-dihydroxy-2-butanone-4-phosphate synthase [Herbiconiux sp. SYSU D00978]
MSLSDIPTAVEHLRQGRPVIVVDDESRENEGDVVLAAQLASPEWIAWTIRNSSGFICAPMTNAIADRLELPLMVLDNEDPRTTAYTVTVDAAENISTGISAADRSRTLRVLGDPASAPEGLRRPGHILPLRAVDGGVRERSGHTEASVDLMKLAGLNPVAVISEVMDERGEMMRLPALLKFGEAEGVPVVTIEQLIAYLQEWHCDTPVPAPVEATESPRVRFEVSTTVPTTHGSYEIRAYRDLSTGADHVAIVKGRPQDGALVRLHSECLTGEAFGSLKCECGPQLDAALDAIEREGSGVVVYLRGHEGRAIGLVNKLRAYRLQEDGLDTLEANLALGLPADARDYGAASAMLADLGLSHVRLLSNNPEKRRQLEQSGITVDSLVPLVVGVNAINEGYLDTKRDRMGHRLPDHQTLDAARVDKEGRIA